MRIRCGMVAMIVALAVILLMTIPAAAPAAVTLNSYERQIVELVNKERVKRGLCALRVNASLVRAARSHSAEMGTQKFFDHSSLSGETCFKRMVRHGYKRTGYRYWKAGENIYYGAGIYSSPYVVVSSWMKAKSHRAVILTKAFRNIGVGAVETTDGFRACSGSVWFFTLDVGRRIAK